MSHRRSNGGQRNQATFSGDHEITPNPSDGISSLACNGDTGAQTTLLCAGSWDNGVYAYHLHYNHTHVMSQPKAKVGHDAPVLSVDVKVCVMNIMWCNVM